MTATLSLIPWKILWKRRKMMGVARVWLSEYGRAVLVVKRWGAVVLERPRQRDYWTVLFLFAVQVAFLACAAIMASFFGKEETDVEAVSTSTENPGILGFFVHNAAVFMVWVLGGMVTLGLVSVLFAGFSALYDGFIIGAAIQSQGMGQLLFLGHGLLEVPAFAIALYLGVRPLLVLVRLKRGRELSVVREIFSGIVIWIACGLFFLAGAAVWEGVVEVPVAES